MPKVANCSFSRCSNGLESSERENFTPSEEAHWRMCHIDEPIKFTCPYMGHDVELQRNPERWHLFICVCGKSCLLHSGSVRWHYISCPSIMRQVTQAMTSQSVSEPQVTSMPENAIHDTSPALSMVSEVVSYNDSKFSAFSNVTW